MSKPCSDMIPVLQESVKNVTSAREAISKAILELSMEVNKKRKPPDPNEIDKLADKLADAIKSGDSVHKDAEKMFDKMENHWYKLNPGAKNFAGPLLSEECTQAAHLIQVGNKRELPELAKLFKKANDEVRSARKKKP